MWLVQEAIDDVKFRLCSNVHFRVGHFMKLPMKHGKAAVSCNLFSTVINLVRKDHSGQDPQNGRVFSVTVAPLSRYAKLNRCSLLLKRQQGSPEQSQYFGD